MGEQTLSLPRPRSTLGLGGLLLRDPAAMSVGIAVLRFARVALLEARTPAPLTTAGAIHDAETALQALEKGTTRHYGHPIVPPLCAALTLEEAAKPHGQPTPERHALQQGYKTMRLMARSDVEHQQWAGRDLPLPEQVALALWQWPTEAETVGSNDVTGFPWLALSYWRQFTLSLLLLSRQRHPHHPMWALVREWEGQRVRAQGLAVFMTQLPPEPPALRTGLGPLRVPSEVPTTTLQRWALVLLARMVLSGAETQAVASLLRLCTEDRTMARWSAAERDHALWQWLTTQAQQHDYTHSHRMAWSHLLAAVRPHVPHHAATTQAPPLPPAVSAAGASLLGLTRLRRTSAPTR